MAVVPFLAGPRDSSLIHSASPAKGPTQSPTQWVQECTALPEYGFTDFTGDKQPNYIMAFIESFPIIRQNTSMQKFHSGNNVMIMMIILLVTGADKLSVSFETLPSH
jgi:hypothetical protein